jgi:aldose 1-epimerase
MIKKELLGAHLGRDVYAYTISNANGVSITVMEFGAVWMRLVTPDKSGKMDDLLLGYDSLKEYIDDGYYFGVLLGRCANRIAHPDITIGNRQVHLQKNEGAYHLHGGKDGFHKQLYCGQILSPDTVSFQRVSPDGEAGYPGNLAVTVYYTLTDDNTVRIRYQAISDADTIVSLSSHGYFNLSGGASGRTVLHDRLLLRSGYYTEIDKDCAMTGAILSADGTGMDFQREAVIEERLKMGGTQIQLGSGYNHTYALSESSAPAAVLKDDESGRMMEVFTDAPGVHLYIGNYLDGVRGKGGASYGQYQAACFETQYYPEAIRFSHFPSPLLKAGEAYHSETSFRFSVMR